MKKLCILFVIIALLIAPVTAYAAGVTFTIDDINKYDDMEKSYNEGYTPTFYTADSKWYAKIILPLRASDDTFSNEITVTPGLGDTNSSPFVYKNYQKTVGRGSYEFNGVPVLAYLVEFDLELAPGRVNGVYPVMIGVQADGANSASFTCYVTITNGKNPQSEPTPEKPTSQPKIIVSSYSINPSPVMAGEEFTADITLENTSGTKSVQNMSVSVSCDCPNFELLDDTNTIYIGKLAKNATTDIEVRYKTDLETPPQRYNITLSMEYDNSVAQTLSSQGNVTITVKQPMRVEIEAPKVPQQVNAGDTMPLSFQVMNMGRSKVYNVRCQLAAPGLIPSETAFIGNMEAGTAMQGDMDVFIGTKDMTEGYEGEDKYGFTSGTITLIYEDEAGQEYFESIDFSTTINPPVIAPVSAEPAEEPEKASQWWISLIIGGTLIAILAVIIIARGKKVKQNEDF
jgi:hypothetical protein